MAPTYGSLSGLDHAAVVGEAIEMHPDMGGFHSPC
jgi:hypothetical protein